MIRDIIIHYYLVLTGIVLLEKGPNHYINCMTWKKFRNGCLTIGTVTTDIVGEELAMAVVCDVYSNASTVADLIAEQYRVATSNPDIGVVVLKYVVAFEEALSCSAIPDKGKVHTKLFVP